MLHERGDSPSTVMPACFLEHFYGGVQACAQLQSRTLLEFPTSGQFDPQVPGSSAATSMSYDLFEL